jgi:hypothetical protein
MSSRPLPQENLARNLRYLMEAKQENPRMLCERLRGQVSQRTVANILNCEKIARIDTVDLIAAAYNLSGWHLISPTLIDDLSDSPTLRKLVDDFKHSTKEGQELISQIAAREASVRKP